jgi:sugar diacid utilization regulator/putative methionine-R-sulfoxide reductase with GAF domain
MASALAGTGEAYLRRLLGATTVSEVTQAAVDGARRALDTDVSWSGVVEGDFLTMAAHSGLRTAEMTALWRLRVGEGVGGRVARDGRTIAVRDYRRDPRRVPVMKGLIDDEGIVAAICAPLINGRQVLGILYAAERETRDWTPEETRMVTALARDAGAALAVIREQRRAEATRRSLEVVGAMAAALARTEDLGAGLGTLADDRGLRVELVGRGGEVLRQAGAPADAPVRVEVDVGDDPLVVLRIRGERELAPPEVDLVGVCADLIELALLRERTALVTELRVHGELLDDLLEGRSAAVPARGALLGIDLSVPRYVACLGLRGVRPVAVTRGVLDGVETTIRARFPRSVVAGRGGDVVVLLEPAGAAVEQVVRVLREATGETLGAGLGRLCLGADAYADSYAEAALGLDLARRRAHAGAVLTPADLGLYGLLARGSARESLESMVEQALGPIVEADGASGSEYVKTLDAYLACDRHLEPTAHTLHVHPNTVRYRLAKVQELLGVSLRDVDDRFLLELALRVQATLERA